ncbi:MAG TPA: translocation/assembly module TamB domain-containing protein [Bacteroidia bacterium]|nr:translocation/assembly module TamB domain-containing protein [Bacteroidia bacterium]
MFQFHKSIKKLGKIFLYFLAAVILLLTASYLLLRSASVQTWLSKRVAANLSEKLKTRVEVGGVDFEFVKTLVLEDVFIGDLHQDTVLCAQKLKVDIGYLGFSDQWLLINDLSLVNAKVKLKKYKGEHDMAYTFLLDALSSSPKKDTVRNKATWKLTLNTINLTNLEFIYDFKQNSDTSWGMNYRNIRATSVNARFSDIRGHGDTLHLDIEYLSTREKSGFILKSMSGTAELSMHAAEFKNLRILTPNSDVNTYLLFTYRDPADLEEFVDSVKMKAVFSHSTVSMADIAYFARDLKGMNQKLELKGGTASGKITNLKGKDLDIAFGKSSSFRGDVSFQGLPDIEQTYIIFKATEVRTNKQDLEQVPVPPFDKGTLLKLPPNFAMLGNIRFHGTWEGFFSEFVAYGEFNTAIGSLSSDISFRTNKDKRLSYQGKLKVKDFDAGRFLGLPAFGKVSMTGEFEGKDISNANSEILLKNGVAQYIQLNNYTYQNVKFDGQFSRKELSGNLSIDDDNIALKYNGSIDFKGQEPLFDFSAEVKHANLVALHFYDPGKPAVLSAKVDVNMSGNNIDNLLGLVRISGLEYTQDKTKATLPEVRIAAREDSQGKVISLSSDYVDASLSGRFTLLDFNVYMRKMLAAYIPAYFSDPVPKTRQKNKKKYLNTEDFTAHVLLKNTDMLSNLFFPDFTAAHNTGISGSVNTGTEQLKLDATSKSIGIYGKRFQDWTLHAGNQTADRMSVSTTSSRILFNDSVGVDHFSLNTTEQHDTVALKLDWKNNTQKKYSGSINAGMKVLSPGNMTLAVKEARVFLEDSLWKESPGNLVRFDSAKVFFHDFGFTNNQQVFNLDGIVSGDKNDVLSILIHHMNLANINTVVGSQGLTLKGLVDSRTTVSDLYHNVVFTSSSTFSGLQINNDTIGDGSVESLWDMKKEGIYLHGNFTRDLVPGFLFSGFYYPAKPDHNLDFEITLSRLNLAIFKPYVKDFCRNFDGKFSGNLALRGSLKEPALTGSVTADADRVTFNYLNTNYKFKEQIITLEENAFIMPDFVILDEYGNKATVKNGRLTHDHFRNFHLNFPVETEKFMCLNTTEADNTDYYGTAFVTGLVSLTGTIDNLNIDASVKTEKVFEKKTNRTHYTNFFIPLENTGDISQNNFISFVKRDSVKRKTNYKVDLSGLSLNFSLEVTPDANVQMIFDQKVGDVIKAKGAGNIQMNISTLGKFSMYGDYSIENGEYLFTLKNLINKKFKIERGGTISWAGDPKDATINLNAVYQVRAVLKPVVQSDSTGRRYPVNCTMNLTGSLLQPNINFDIDLPTVDETTRQEVKRNVNNEQEVNRQVLALLVLNSFVPPVGSEAQTGAGLTTTTAGLTTSSELLSNQLSNWLSQISSDFDLRVKYRPGDVVNRDQMELALSTQALNDRLTLDGSVISGATNQKNTNNVVGDLNVEYKLTRSGKLRLKAYNKTNDNTVLNADAPYSQGMGLAYKEEFNTLTELMNRYKEKLRRLFGGSGPDPVVPDPGPKLISNPH